MLTFFRRQLPVLLLTVLLLPLGACGKGDPEQIRQKLHLPEPGYVPDLERGRMAFTETCAVCHGGNGRGSRQGPPLLHKTYEPGHHPDMAFHLAVKNGVRQHHWNFGDMPPQPDISPGQVSDIIAYIRMEQRRVGIE